MDEPATRPPVPPASAHSLAAPSPLPTPPSSTTTIPPFFPSPTSVDLTASDEAPQPRSSKPNPTPSHSNNHAPNPPDHPAPKSVPSHLKPPLHPSQQSQQPDKPQPSPPSEHQPPSITAPPPSPPLTDVTRAQFLPVLHNFLHHQPPIHQIDYQTLADRLRHLFDHLDGLVEQIPLRISNTVCDALAQPRSLTTLLYLLADISAKSSSVIRDVRRAYRYPYITTAILANGTMNIRDAFIASSTLVSHLLSFLDGQVPLLDAPHPPTAVKPTPSQLACHNPIIVGNVVQILVSYLGTNPEVLLQQMRDRPSFLPALVDMLHIGSVPLLIAALIPDRCVDDVLLMDHCNASFDLPMTNAVTLLASANIYHCLANAFVSGTQTIYSATVSDPVNNVDTPNADQVTKAEQLAFNVTQVYANLVKKTLRAVRINGSMPACQYLHVFGNPDTAGTIALILNSGIELFRETNGFKTAILENALSLTTQLLECVDEDSERRVASVTGQPPALDTSALEAELQPILRCLIGVLIDIVNRDDGQSGVRLGILELFVTCMRVCSEQLMRFIDKQRFGEIAFKIMMLHPRNSLIQHVVCRGVESGLLSPKATKASVYHWLVRCNLMDRIVHVWKAHQGDKAWNSPRKAQEAPYLSALIHMACCVQHFFAVQQNQGRPQLDVGVSPESKKRFEAFCEETVAPIVSLETVLCGPKPKRRMAQPPGGMGRAFGVLSRSSSAGSICSGFGRRSGVNNSGSKAHLVRSLSAHRFGYVAPVSSLRSRFDDVFVEGGDDEFEAVTSFSGFGDLGDVLG